MAALIYRLLIPSFTQAAVACLTLCSTLVFAQHATINGRVIDAKTLKPLPFASVYCNNTTIGSATDLNGEFTLGSLKTGDYEVVFSFVGYGTYKVKVSLSEDEVRTLNVKLVAAAGNLQEVTVNSKRDEKWKGQFERFRKLFFGAGPIAASCKIFNPWVLDFVQDNAGMLTAKASAPLEIENLGLGYRITYSLKDFSVGPSSYKIGGDMKFTPLQTTDTALSALWKERRVEAYLGSSRHLLVSMINNSAVEDGFILFEDISGTVDIVRKATFLSNLNVSLKPLETFGRVMPRPGRAHYRIQLPKRTEIQYVKRNVPASVYRNVPNPVSWIEVAETLEVNKDGLVINAGSMTILGAMGEARVALALPNDYQPPLDDKGKIAVKTKKPLSPLAFLLEKPYLHMDREYYYPGDMICFKAYMNYASHQVKDSLSHVLYVELIDQKGHIHLRSTLPLRDGVANGTFTLPMRFPPGSYAVRAYTRWMINFNRDLIFLKPIAILDEDLFVKPEGETHGNEDGLISITADKTSYSPREKINIALQVFNSTGNPVASDISVAVSDIEQVVHGNGMGDIVKDFAIDEIFLTDSSLQKPRIAVQYGIDFKGYLTNKRGMPTEGTITVFQKGKKDVFALPAGETGHFAEQLQFFDSAEFYLQGKNKRGKNAKVHMDTTAFIKPTTPFTALQLNTYKPSGISRKHFSSSFFMQRMLEEVVVQAKKSEAPTKGINIQSDYSIDGEWLRSTNTTDLLSAIQRRVPGLRLVYSIQSGNIGRSLVFGAPSGFAPTQEVLVTIDGVTLSPMPGQSVSDQLSVMTIHSIESIEVLRFGSAAMYGARGGNGVIVVKTKSGNFDSRHEYSFDPRKLKMVKMNGYSASPEFQAPEYVDTSVDDEQVDSRSTVYWNPLILTNDTDPSSISFYAADIPTTYRIVAEGLDAFGNPVRGVTYLTIKRD